MDVGILGMSIQRLVRQQSMIPARTPYPFGLFLPIGSHFYQLMKERHGMLINTQIVARLEPF